MTGQALSGCCAGARPAPASPLSGRGSLGRLHRAAWRLLVAIPLVVAVGCGGGEVRVPPGELVLELVWTAWDERASAEPDRDVFVVRTRLHNGRESAPASLSPVLFSMETSGGVEVLGMPSSLNGQGPCEPDISVVAGASRECSLGFRLPAAESPTALIYRAAEQDRQARVAIEPCSTAAPAGLCDRGRTCFEGICATPCSSAHPNGVCPDSDQVCSQIGSCEPVCSPSEPMGLCAQGTCIDGRCDESVCWTLTLSGDCAMCLDFTESTCVAAGDWPTCSEYGTDAEDCLHCPLPGSQSTCSCLDYDWSCRACSPTSAARQWYLDYWSCIAEHCPSCVN